MWLVPPRKFFGTVPSNEEDMPKVRKPSHMIGSRKEIYSGHVQLYSNSVQIFDGEAVYLNRTLKVSEGLSK